MAFPEEWLQRQLELRASIGLLGHFVRISPEEAQARLAGMREALRRGAFPQLATIDQAAGRLNVSRSQVNRLLDQGELEAWRIFGPICVGSSSIDKYNARGGQPIALVLARRRSL